jgi:hypothetical protein
MSILFCSASTGALISADEPPLMRYFSSLSPNIENGLSISVDMKSTIARLD